MKPTLNPNKTNPISAYDISVIIPTRDRMDDLLRCVLSMRLIEHHKVEILVMDDGSINPVEPILRRQLPPDFKIPLRVMRHERSTGSIYGLNEMSQKASGKYLLTMNDDAYLRDRQSINQAVQVLNGDSQAGAVALSQTDAEGRQVSYQPGNTLCPPLLRTFCGERFRPGNSTEPVIVRAFYGYGALLRRSTFNELGGYREIFYYYAEEPEYCKRMMAAGFHVVYLPEGHVAHCPNQVGRSLARITAYMWRNGCYGAIMNESLPRLIYSIPARLLQFLVYRLRIGGTNNRKESKEWGIGWILRDMWRDFPQLRKERKKLSRRTITRWDKLRIPQPYDMPKPTLAPPYEPTHIESFARTVKHSPDSSQMPVYSDK
ncbi:MAG: glycosyltransferase [Opitutales bacterium]|nr:glycosyltransferase [Opitutales bacterium]